MAITTHCNLRPSNVAPVVLGFNYEAYKAQSYKFNTSVTVMYPHIITHDFRTIRRSADEL